MQCVCLCVFVLLLAGCVTSQEEVEVDCYCVYFKYDCPEDYIESNRYNNQCQIRHKCCVPPPKYFFFVFPKGYRMP
uniref:Uncharacterized shell protein 12 n=1 Tax=Margaritifera margaritifera TaxID=102329 RepID=USP12_PINMG|nr:RecName: Full=Uncharacterized shell protein 12; AltName: Full=Nacre uncharacterized shell protein 20; Flags: Precursor [Pinctada margaritifera]CCE46184.1 nacre uncharacterized shell protein 20 [Pinctada margaritifera]